MTTVEFWAIPTLNQNFKAEQKEQLGRGEWGFGWERCSARKLPVLRWFLLLATSIENFCCLGMNRNTGRRWALWFSKYESWWWGFSLGLPCIVDMVPRTSLWREREWRGEEAAGSLAFLGTTGGDEGEVSVEMKMVYAMSFWGLRGAAKQFSPFLLINVRSLPKNSLMFLKPITLILMASTPSTVKFSYRSNTYN